MPWVLKHLFLLASCLVVGTLWHELVGHGLVGAVCGGRVVHVHVLGLDLYPAVRWLGWQGHYGECDVEGIPTARREASMSLAGSASTWLVAVVANLLLVVRRWRPPWRIILCFLSIWWIDILTYTLPTWGFRRSILWGRRYSEPYDAAVALGIPGPVFQTFVVATSALMAAGLVREIVRQRRSRRSAT